MKEYIQKLKMPEKNGKKIGVFRIICAIFGGLIVSLLSMALFITITSVKKEDMTLATIIIDASVWALVAFWIALASSKYIALLRVIIPTIVFSILLIIFYNI